MGHRIQNSFNQKGFNQRTKKDISSLKKELSRHKTQSTAATMELNDVIGKCNSNSNTLSEKVEKLHTLSDTNSKSLLDLAATSSDLSVRLESEIHRNENLQKDTERFTTVMIVLVLMLLVFCLINTGVI